MARRYLVTGAAGFIGSALLDTLVKDAQSVVAVTRGSIPDDPRPVQWMQLNPQDPQSWKRALEGVSAVFHLGWSTVPQTASADPVGDLNDNVVSCLRLFEAMDNGAVERFVFASSGGTVYGRVTEDLVDERHSTRPISAYGVSKLTVEHYLEMLGDQIGLDSVSLRIGNPFGPGQTKRANFGAVTTFARLGLQQKPITIFGDGSTVRDYIYIDDLSEALLSAGKARGGPNVINIGSGIGRSLNDIVGSVENALGRRLEVIYTPARRFDVPSIVLDSRRAHDALGWLARTPFDDAVRRTVDALAAS